MLANPGLISMSPSLGVSIRITGADSAAGKAGKVAPQALENLRVAASERAQRTVSRLQAEIAGSYTSAWATGRLGRSVSQKTVISGNGVNVSFSIGGFRELSFVTALLGGVFSQKFMSPFVITPSGAKYLHVPRAGVGGRGGSASQARNFIQGKGGRLRGSRSSFMKLTKVLWGSQTGGFDRDVIKEVLDEESDLFVADMQQAVQDAIITVTSKE